MGTYASSFEQASAQLASVVAQQTDLQRAVAAGELWMEAGVAERAPAFTSFFGQHGQRPDRSPFPGRA
ncbi:MAG: hypothetical protein M3228_09195 [Actinomycetota bacterium]|nr:hypothetical protein [Actinomycetota bacterium]